MYKYLNTPINLFISYSHKDEELKNNLKSHLMALKRCGLINIWHDREILSGQEWEGEINEHLDNAHIILLLISSDFIQSDFCYGVEMKHAMARQNFGDAVIVPVILRDCHWDVTPLGKLQALPHNGKAVTSWPNIDEAFNNVVQGICDLIKEGFFNEQINFKYKRIENYLKETRRNKKCHAHKSKIDAWEEQIINIQERIQHFRKIFKVTDPIHDPERYEEIKLKIEVYSQELDKLEIELKSME